MNGSITNTRTEETMKREIEESRFESINRRDLMGTGLPPLHHTISTILSHGFFILAGGTKVGRSWLAEQISYIVANGGQIWGYRTIQSEVLYLGLEDTVTCLQSRFEILEAYEDMENIHFILKANGITSGVEEDIHDYLTQHPSIRLVVIDALQRIRGNEFVKNIYAGDVEFTNILRQISMKFDLTIFALAHISKDKHDDDISKISGSRGMVGGTDGNWVLTKSKRTDTRADLTISNHDTEAFEFALEFDKGSCRWNKLTRGESAVDEKERFLHAIANFVKAEEAHHWEGTTIELLTNLQTREPALVSYSAAVFSKSLKAAQDSLREIYGVPYVSTFHNKKKWIALDYIEVK